jgi:hypothetical protein
MTRILRVFFRFSIAVILSGAALLWSGQLTLGPTSSLVSSAEARIGRPLTPLSYAAYAAPVVVAPAPACAQVVDVYGRVVTVCR